MLLFSAAKFNMVPVVDLCPEWKNNHFFLTTLELVLIYVGFDYEGHLRVEGT